MSKIKIFPKSFFALALLGTFSLSNFVALPVGFALPFVKNSAEISMEQQVGSIKISPSLESATLKNGEMLRIKAAVFSASPIVTATAKIDGIAANIPLHLFSGTAQSGEWKAEWQATGLQERNYPITLTFTDDKGLVQTNAELSFSDPIFGQSQVGQPKILNRVNALQGRLTDSLYQVGVIDSTGTFGYFGTYTAPARVIKINLATSTRVSELTLNPGEDKLNTVVMDPSGTFAYFGTDTTTGKIIKINLATMTRVAAISASGANNYGSSVIDHAGNFAYFGTIASGVTQRIVKINLSNFTVASVLAINPTNKLAAALIDPTDTFAYFATANATPKIHKIDLASFTNTSTLTLAVNDGPIATAAVDSLGGFAYFGANTNPANITKVDLGTFTRVSGLALNAGEAVANTSFLDSGNNFGYFGTNFNATIGHAVLVKVNLATFTRDSAVNFNAAETNIVNLLYDSTHNLVYSTIRVGQGSASSIVKVDLATPVPTRVSVFTPLVGDVFRTVVVNSAGTTAYFATKTGSGSTDTGKIFKVNLTTNPPTIVDSLTLAPGDGDITSGVIDAANHFAYFGLNSNTLGSPGRILKVDLTTPNLSQVAIGSLVSGEVQLESAALDSTGNFAYFSANCVCGGRAAIVKVDITGGTPVRVGSLLLNVDEKEVTSAINDPVNKFIYFTTDVALGPPGSKIVKVDVSGGLPVRLGALALQTDELPQASTANAALTQAVFATSDGVTSKILHVDLNGALPVLLGTYIFTDGTDLTAATGAYNEADNLAYFTTDSNPAKVVALDVSGATPVLKGSLTLKNNEDEFRTAIFDSINNVLYLGSIEGANDAGELVKVDKSSGLVGNVNAYKVTLATTAQSIQRFRIFSHVGAGNLRLALYDEAKNLVWQSGVLPVSAQERWLTVTVNTGTPAVLNNVPAGTYYLAFQTSSQNFIPAVMTGNDGDGFQKAAVFGAFPASISGEVLNNQIWSFYGAYTGAAPAHASVVSNAFDIFASPVVPVVPEEPVVVAPPVGAGGGGGFGNPACSGAGCGNPAAPNPVNNPPVAPPVVPVVPSVAPVNPPVNSPAVPANNPPANPLSQSVKPKPPATKPSPVQPIVPPANPEISPTPPISSPTQNPENPPEVGSTGENIQEAIWKATYKLSEVSGYLDSDNDGVSDALELRYGTNPYQADSDGDGIADNVEIFDYQTNPLDAASPGKNFGFVKITNFLQGQLVADTTPFIKGVAPAGSTVSILIQNDVGQQQVLGQTVASDNGVFVFEQENPLKDGKIYLVAKANGLVSEPVEITIDSTLNVMAPKIEKLDNQPISDELLLKNLHVEVVNNRPTLYGTTDFGNKVSATWKSVITTSALIADATDGHFAISAPNVMEAGEHVVYVTATRQADGAQSKTVKLLFSIKTAQQLLLEKNWWWILIAIILVAGVWYYLWKKRKQELGNLKSE